MKESKKLLHLTRVRRRARALHSVRHCQVVRAGGSDRQEDRHRRQPGPAPDDEGKYVSEGMIFAADTDVDGGCSIAFFPDNTPAGARIH